MRLSCMGFWLENCGVDLNSPPRGSAELGHDAGKKPLNMDALFYTLPQDSSLSCVEEMPILQALSQDQTKSNDIAIVNHLN